MFPSAFAVVDARKLHEDASILELLNVGLCDTELVDPLADDALRVVDGRLRFRPKDGKNFFVRAFGREEILVLHVVEDSPQLDLRASLRPSSLEQRHKVVPCGFAQCLGIGQRSAEIGIVAVVRQSNDQIWQADLERDAHASFQVKAQVEFLLLDVSVRVVKNRVNLGRGTVAEEFTGRLGRHFFVRHVAECFGTFQGIGHIGAVFIRCGFVSTCHPVE